MSEPNWANVTEVVSVTVTAKNQVIASRRYACHEADQEDADEPRAYTEIIWPAYVSTPPAGAGAGGGTEASQPPRRASDVATADRYWAEAAREARSTAKWIAAALGVALAAVVGTAPLTPLGGEDVDWWSGPGAAVVAGVLLLGVTLFLVVSVLVPGVTGFAALMGAGATDKPLRERLSVSSAQLGLARRAKAKHGVLLPIGVGSLDELGHRVRLEELTLNSVAEELADAGPGPAGDTDRAFWTEVKKGRGQILQGYLDEAAQWVVVASYLAVKVRTDRARSFGLAVGLVGALALVWGYLALQPSTARPTAHVSTYIVRTTDPASPARQALGPGCDAFTGVALEGAPAGKLAVYVTGGDGCATGRVVLPRGDVVTATLAPAAPRPSASASAGTPSPSVTSSPSP